jgi:hypothetical protein
MSNSLNERHALTRRCSAPLADERRRYVLHCVEQGMAKSTVRFTAELLIAVEKYLKLAERKINIQVVVRLRLCRARRRHRG